MIIYSFNQYMDILARDNMNFNEYNFDIILNDTSDTSDTSNANDTSHTNDIN